MKNTVLWLEVRWVTTEVEKADEVNRSYEYDINDN